MATSLPSGPPASQFLSLKSTLRRCPWRSSHGSPVHLHFACLLLCLPWQWLQSETEKSWVLNDADIGSLRMWLWTSTRRLSVAEHYRNLNREVTLENVSNLLSVSISNEKQIWFPCWSKRKRYEGRKRVQPRYKSKIFAARNYLNIMAMMRFERWILILHIKVDFTILQIIICIYYYNLWQDKALVKEKGLDVCIWGKN